MIVTVPASARTAIPIEIRDIKRLRIDVVSGRAIIRQSRPSTGFCLCASYGACDPVRGIGTRYCSEMPAAVVYLIDVDNTLLDNDQVVGDLMRHLNQNVGEESAQLYWRIFERLRTEVGYADYLGALQAYRATRPHDLQILKVSSFLINYPFETRLFPRALEVIQRLNTWGPTVILSDGDVVFQPRKIQRSGLEEAVGGRGVVQLECLADGDAQLLLGLHIRSFEVVALVVR
jgi:hypothetical protein